MRRQPSLRSRDCDVVVRVRHLGGRTFQQAGRDRRPRTAIPNDQRLEVEVVTVQPFDSPCSVIGLPYNRAIGCSSIYRAIDCSFRHTLSVFQVADWSKTRHDRPMEELLTVAAVARQIGLAPATLRTWARRYGLGPSSHEAGEHRRYCASDLAKLILMRRLISAGVSPAEAAEQALAHKGEVKVEKILKTFEVREDVVHAIVNAANSLDRNFVESILRKDLDKYGVIDSWQEVIVPVLIIVGDEWAETGTGIEVEHLLSETITGLLRERSKQLKTPVNSRPVLLASVGEELHCLALHALHAALADAKIECNFLGARTPLEALSNMVTRSAPPAVFLWAQLPKNGDPKYFRDIPSIRPAPRFILGGPGWNRNECSEVAFVDDLTLACEEIKQAIGA